MFKFTSLIKICLCAAANEEADNVGSVIQRCGDLANGEA